MRKKTIVWLLLTRAIVVAAALGLLLPPPVTLAGDGDMEIERKDCGCPSGWVAVAGGTQCLNTQTEEIIPYCRNINT